MWSVYMHTHKENGKRYIGITGKKPEYRWANGKGYTGGSFFRKAIDKYGWEMFTHEILFDELTKEDACKLEVELIAKYKTNDPRFGYNNSTGGESGTLGSHFKFSEETKQKMRKPKSELHRKRISEANKGERNGMYGKHLTAEAKRKLSDSRKGRAATESQLTNLLKGQAILAERCKKAVVCIETGEEYESAIAASRATDIDCSILCKNCKGKRQHAGRLPDGTKLHWRYKDTG